MPKMIPKVLDWGMESENELINFDLQYLTMKEQGQNHNHAFAIFGSR